MNKNILKLNRISSILFRVLPSVKYDIKLLNKLYAVKEVKSYFKNIRKLQEYPGMYNYFRTFGFDVSLCDSVRKEIEHTNSTFLKNLNSAQNTYSDPTENRKLCKVNQDSLDFLYYRVFIDLFPNKSLDSLQFTPPSFDDIINAINLSASQGLPNPFLKKRDILPELKNHVLKFLNRELKASDIFKFPSAVFMRSQIRSSGLKIRLVHAVQAYQQVIESFYYLYFKSGLPTDSCITIGKTQLEISSLLANYDNRFTYCIDHQSWDISRQPILSVISFEILLEFLDLNAYTRKMLILCRNYYLTLPSFHPQIELTRRYVGTVSGSGFTSLDNSMCNWILTTLLIYNYCKKNKLDPYQFDYIINVSGDDLILGTRVSIDISEIFLISEKRFGSKMKLELPVSIPGNSNYFFLGSHWKHLLPYREEKTLVASVVFGSGNFPNMTHNELFQSRFFEVFGNSADTLKYWKRFRIPPIRRLFFFKELFNPFKSGSPFSIRNVNLVKKIAETSSKDSRGYWFDVNLSSDVISSLWMMR